MSNAKDTFPFEDERVINHPEIPEDWTRSVVVGTNEVSQFISNLVVKEINKERKNYLLAIDGFLGAEWKTIILRLKKLLKEKELNVEIIDIASCYKISDEIEKIINPFLTDDPVFGKLWVNGKIESFFDREALKSLRKKLRNYKNQSPKSADLPNILICFGCGASIKSLIDLYDSIFYVDVTRRELVKRAHKESASNLGDNSKSRSFKYILKRLYYIDFPVLDRHRKYLLSQMDFYIDGNIIEEPKLVPQDIFNKILSRLVQYPFRPKPVYIPGVWGGQWLKKIRKLPQSKVNCAWSYEIIPYEQSLLIAVGNNFLDIPFLNLLWREDRKILGDFAVKKFQGSSYFELYFFPITFNYDDTMSGGNMSIQVHPHYPYIKKHFNEPYSHHESYYIIDTGPGSKVHFGLREGINKDEFYKTVRRAETKGISFDHNRYVNSVPTRAGDYFLIPAGTVHGSGRNEVVLEIDSCNCTELTFKIYDYLRLDLNGKPRPIHSQHAFQVIKFSRRARWAMKHLKQSPKLIRSGDCWAEYIIGELEELFFVTHRLEFVNEIDDETKEKFHILTLVEGDSVLIQSRKYRKREFKLNFSETVIIPACFEKYFIINLGHSPCKVVKALLK